jgi:hypothetical protein
MLVPIVETENTEQHIAVRIAEQISHLCFRSDRPGKGDTEQEAKDRYLGLSTM